MSKARNKRQSTQPIDGSIKDIVYRNASGWSIMDIQTESGDLIRVVGDCVDPTIGERLSLRGEWSEHLEYGQVYCFNDYVARAPSNLNHLMDYLEKACGINHEQASQLVKYFGTSATDILDRAPDQLNSIEEFDEDLVDHIIKHWQNGKSIDGLKRHLESYHIDVGKLSALQRIIGFDDDITDSLRVNPYLLYFHFNDIPWRTVEKMAEDYKVDPLSHERIKGAIYFVMKRNAMSGDTYLEKESLPDRVAKVLQFKKEKFIDNFERALNSLKPEYIAISDDKVYLAKHFRSETDILASITRLEREETYFEASLSVKRIHKYLQDEYGYKLTDDAVKNISSLLTNKLATIETYPGKEHDTLIQVLSYLLTQVMATVTVCVMTVSRAVQLRKLCSQSVEVKLLADKIGKNSIGSPTYNRSNPVESDVLIIDQADAIDIELMSMAFDATRNECAVFMLGDPNGLYPIGPGQPFYDIVSTHRVYPVKLENIGLPAGNGTISKALRAIRKNETVTLPSSFDPHDPIAYLAADADEIPEVLNRLMSDLIPLYGYNQTDDVQILTPTKRGKDLSNGRFKSLPVDGLNASLQELLNPTDKRRFIEGKNIAQGDKVIFLQERFNDYVPAGTVAYIENIATGNQVPIRSPLGVNALHPPDFYGIDLAYITTVFRYIGQRTKLVILVIYPEQASFITKKLVYSSLSMAHERLIIVGSKSTFIDGLEKATPRHKSTLPVSLRS